MSRASALVWAAALMACPSQTPVPGDTVVGAFGFQTWLTRDGCSLADAGMPASFTGTVSYDSATGRAYLTSGAGNLEGTVSGDFLDLGGRAERGFPKSSCAGWLSERLTARMIGEAEARAAGYSCDAGLSLDAGSGATQGDAGFGAVLICGTITDELSGPEDGGDACYRAPCAVEFALSGSRQQ